MVIRAIQEAEKETSGEIRVFVESRCAYLDPIDRAREVFYTLKMEQTRYQNAVIVYLALVDHQVALFGDEGIFRKTGGDPYWFKELETLKRFLIQDKVAEGLSACIRSIGATLSEYFPYNAETDKNELPDEIVFGK